ncbi:unnamed protein product [Closterium sp. NIES-64]|nr:unnamed protein product [Closterium sp. Naga37s-1]CAI5978535.1 unnamed protein product [Closterium sp. NIES-64]
MHALSSLTVIPASRFALSPCRGGASLRAARSPLDACSGPAPASRARCMGGDAQSGGGGSSGAESSAKAVAGARTARGSGGAQVMELRVDEIRRPLMRTRSNDQEKVAALMASIKEIGLQEPIDVLEVEGLYYGFSGCHRYEAHQRLGLPTIKCRVRRASRDVLRMHMR